MFRVLGDCAMSREKINGGANQRELGGRKKKTIDKQSRICIYSNFFKKNNDFVIEFNKCEEE